MPRDGRTSTRLTSAQLSTPASGTERQTSRTRPNEMVGSLPPPRGSGGCTQGTCFFSCSRMPVTRITDRGREMTMAAQEWTLRARTCSFMAALRASAGRGWLTRSTRPSQGVCAVGSREKQRSPQRQCPYLAGAAGSRWCGLGGLLPQRGVELVGLLAADETVAVGIDLAELRVGAAELAPRHVAVAVAVPLAEPLRPLGQFGHPFRLGAARRERHHP